MISRNIINYNGEIVGELCFPDGTSEEVIAEKLAEYAKAPPTPQQILESYLQVDIKGRKNFADELMERFKKRNMLDGITAIQGMHMHHIFRAYPVSFGGQNFTIDLMNLAISGDLEIATLSLIYGYTDDMSQPYHWFSAERKQWVITELKKFLGWA